MAKAPACRGPGNALSDALVTRGSLLGAQMGCDPRAKLLSPTDLTPSPRRVLKEQEDTVRGETVQVDHPGKKRPCCGR